MANHSAPNQASIIYVRNFVYWIVSRSHCLPLYRYMSSGVPQQVGRGRLEALNKQETLYLSPSECYQSLLCGERKREMQRSGENSITEHRLTILGDGGKECEEVGFILLKWANPCLFLFIFALLKHNIYRKKLNAFAGFDL